MAKTQARYSVVTANRLRDGAVVYLAADGTWTERIEAAAVAGGEAALAALTHRAEESAARNLVIDVAVIAVADAGQTDPATLREQIRRRGPTVRPDLARA
jgi:hypothetical protein